MLRVDEAQINVFLLSQRIVIDNMLMLFQL